MRKLLLYILFSIPTLLVAQQYNFINYSIKAGLAQSQVEDIVQDNKGYLWIATLGGISRFDGKEFISYSSSDGLLDNQINCITQTRDGSLWIGTLGGAIKYDGRTFTNVPLDEKHAGFNVVCITEDRSGNLWLGMSGGGICRLNYSSDNPEELRMDYFGTDQGLMSNKVRALLIDQEGNLLAATRKGLSIFKDGDWSTVDIHGFNAPNISDLVLDPSGSIWISTYGKGILNYRVDPAKDDQVVILQIGMADGLISDWARSVIIDNNGNLWVASKNGVSKLTSTSNFKSKDVEISNLTSAQGMPSDNIKCLFEDREGNIWMGTDGKGILNFTGESFVGYTEKDGLLSDLVMSIVEDNDNNLWFSTYGKGISKYDGTQFYSFTVADGIGNNTVWASMKDQSGNLWFGTSDGLCIYENNKFRTLNTEDGLISKKVTSVIQAKDASIWIGTSAGVSHYADGSFLNYSAEQGFNGKNVRSIIEAKDGVLWFGTSDGLISYDGSIFKKHTEEDGLSDNTVYTIVEDSKGGLWMGTKNGITHYSNGQFKTILIEKNFRANFINFLVFDSEENLWAGTNNGIYSISIDETKEGDDQKMLHYTNWEGIKSLETNLNGCFLDHQNNLWFCTSEGVVKYDKSKTKTLSQNAKPIINISAVSLFLENTDWSSFTGNFNVTSGLPENLQLKYNQNHLTFYFTGISHSNPDKVDYKFILEGFDKTWSPISKSSSATYSNIPAGDYTFKVIAKNKHNNWNEVPATLRFAISPPFWMTWWFYLTASIATILISVLIYRSRMRVIKRKMLTKRVIQKSKMLILEQKALNASMNRHFIFNALNSIQYYINKEDKRSANNYLTNFAKLIRKNLDDAQSNLISLSDELERLELYLSLENMRFKNKFDYEINVDKNLDPASIKIPSMLLQPFVENSIWHGILPMERKGNVSINIIKGENDELKLQIEDNGIGVDTSIRKKASQRKDHTSRGTRITRSRIELMRKISKKKINISGPEETKDEQNVTTGTKVEITLPFNYN
ncbi:MAG: hypothetical protein COB85_02495 [Bacteroidetes bacterium]|nr:MAG: hypothetical protein COB85_02495 [Bacteroidota bacterium]